MWGYGLGRSDSGQVHVASTFEGDEELSGSINCEEIDDQMKTGQLLKMNFAPWGILYIYIYLFICIHTHALRFA